jgi:hypothetical protein
MKTRESASTQGCECLCVSWASPRGVEFGSFHGVSLVMFCRLSLPVSGGGSRFWFLWGASRIVLWGTFPCMRCSVVCGGTVGGVSLWCVV